MTGKRDLFADKNEARRHLRRDVSGPPTRLEEAVSSALYAARLYEAQPNAKTAGILANSMYEYKAAVTAALIEGGHA